jgi:hypothetical protein
MKKIVIALFILGLAGTAQGAVIIGASVGVTKHTVEGFGKGDSLVANSIIGAGNTTAVLTDVGTPVDSSVADNTDGLAAGFIHDYVFTAVQDTFASIQSAVQLSGSIAGTFISPLVLQVFHLDGVDTQLGSVAVQSDGNGITRSAKLNIGLVAGETYVVRMSNEMGVLGTDPNYTVKVISAVPVPAAVWLFGTALVGLFGFKRKSQAAGAVAA